MANTYFFELLFSIGIVPESGILMGRKFVRFADDLQDFEIL